MNKIAAGLLCVGDVVDLENDPYGDPRDANGEHVNPIIEFEYATVNFIERETPDCVVLGFEGIDRFGFPPDHALPFVHHDPDFEDETT